MIGLTTRNPSEDVVASAFIATPRGECPLEELKIGDRIITRDNGLQKICWVGRRDLTAQDLSAQPHLKPVLIRAGALGNGLPESNMLVSPQHRFLIHNEKAGALDVETEVLAAAKHLVGIQGVDVIEARQASYILFMFEQHEVILSNGTWTECFQPAEKVVDGMGAEQRKEIFALFPSLHETNGVKAYQETRQSFDQNRAKMLVK
ncbi:hypothetical protein PEL8287_00525 [Roseovarius litorisediminis]|uniref:Hedgehog/Intein (Hint) domain-containing protein n=1 Tax=Roseovarius litorisediminis TaxID=1312363 RepID=A0A1Y5RBE5_9RHOB|nr:Hint domain-containing protein [Roseovarius litorisediminis]SLN13474.1 hypothetical protein PEL8287_00525 [Roseovarius litorisediminis]